MTVKELEQRVMALERQVQRLSSQVQATKATGGKGWLAAVEEFAGDEDLLSIFADAQKLREQDRKRTRSRKVAPRKSRS